MPRRFPSQVHQQVSRLLKADYLKTTPVWYQAVLEFPPLPLPPKAPPARSTYDLSPPRGSFAPALNQNRKLTPKKVAPESIHYVEDDVRRQFFRDHPFESFRPVSIVERGEIMDEHPIIGKTWTRLRQRGRNPSSEDAIKYAVNLFKFHDISLTEAYTRAVAQFRALRSEHQIATSFAVMEADAFGAVWAPTQTEQAHEKEVKSLQTWDRDPDLDEGSIAARKRWKMIADQRAVVKSWSKGQTYVKKRDEGERPDYSLEAFRAVQPQTVVAAPAVATVA
jgi:small subunit ribosomal protein S23